MHKQMLSIILFLLISIPFNVLSHEGEDHSHDHDHDESISDSSSQQDRGKGWQLVRSLEIGTSGKFVHMVLIDHSVYTDKTVYSAAINRLCRPEDQFCRIRFWSQERFIPEKVTLTTEQNKNLKADYLVNKTAGTHHLRWSCTVDPDKTHCF